jgi:2-oxoglutarate/2-oxoacid ferredoxin oxidoreductase subunit beta
VHEDGLQPSAGLAKVYTNQEIHDPANLERARSLASVAEPIPVGILYRNAAVPCYEDLRTSRELRTSDRVRTALEAELDKFTIWPSQAEERPAA